jgi:hypothetical protein
MNLQAMIGSLCRKLNYASTPSSDVSERLTGFINEIHLRVLGLPGLGYLKHTQGQFTSVASNAQKSLPADVARVLSIRDTTNDITLAGKSWEWYARSVPDPSASSGTPTIWAPVGFVGYGTQPTGATKLYVVSSSASDTSQTCFVEGADLEGFPLSSTAKLNGTTRVQIGSGLGLSGLGDFRTVNEFYLSNTAVGFVVLTDVTETTYYASLSRGQTYARYLRIALWPTPSDAVTYAIDYERKVDDLSAPMDEPLVPSDFHWVIEAGAKMLEYEKTDDRRYPAAKAEYEQGVRDLKWFVTQQAIDGGPASTPSQLGAWYPAGS